MRLLMLLQTPSQLYVYVTIIMPYLCEDYGPMVLYNMKVLCWFIFINGFANWFCVILYDPSFRKTKDNPYLDISHRSDELPDQFQPLIQEAANHFQNDSVVYDMTAKEGLPWEFCKKCDMHVPPRAYHCKFCKKCILKRDHHCFIVGNCVGFNNQRYFIVFNFYAILVCLLGGIGNVKYLKEVYWPESNGWTDFIPPVALWRWIFYDFKGHICVMVFHLYMQLVFGSLGFVYFTSNSFMAMNGKTLFEIGKKVPIKSTCSRNRNLQSVFGGFWLLNFIFPMTLIFRQKDDGVHWEGIKYDHTAKQTWKEDGE